MNRKAILISRCIWLHHCSLRETVDLIAKEAASIVRQKYTRVTLFSGQTFKNFSVKKYKETDIYLTDEITSISYLYLPRGGKWTEDIQFELVFHKHSEDYFFITLVFPVNDLSAGTDNGLTLGHSLLDLLRSAFDVKWMCLDQLDNSKKPEFFVEGVGNPRLNETEQKIAHAIQLSELVHDKIPFLFAYTYFSSDREIPVPPFHPCGKGYEIYFPQNDDKNFSEYGRDKTWENARQDLSDLNLLHSD